MNEIVDQDAMGEGKIINYLSIIVFFFSPSQMVFLYNYHNPLTYKTI